MAGWREIAESAPEFAQALRSYMEVEEAVTIGLNERRDRLVIQLWRPGRDLVRMERE